MLYTGKEGIVISVDKGLIYAKASPPLYISTVPYFLLYSPLLYSPLHSLLYSPLHSPLLYSPLLYLSKYIISY